MLVWWMELCPSEGHVDVLTPVPINEALLGNGIFAGVFLIQVEIRSYQSKVGPSFNASDILLRKAEKTQRQTQREGPLSLLS